MEYHTLPFQKEPLSPHVILEGYRLSDIKQKLLDINRIKDHQERFYYLKSVFPYFLFQFLSHDQILRERQNIPGWFTSLLNAMNKSENFIAGLPALIQNANMSQEYLNRAFRRYIDMTPTEYINIKRVNHAAGLLLQKDKQIIEVSAECGFHNLSHFYRIFKKQFGSSPKKFVDDYKRH